MIREIKKEDKMEYVKMAKEFYSSDAVEHSIPDVNIENTFQELMRSKDYTEGYIIESDKKAAGYALLAKTFSQEAGGMVIWIEELYIKPEFRSLGLGSEFFRYMKGNLLDESRRVRLEVMKNNKKAISLYEKIGFDDLSYSQMIMDIYE